MITRDQALSAFCPTCGAEPGDRCLGRTGPRVSIHRERYRATNPILAVVDTIRRQYGDVSCKACGARDDTAVAWIAEYDARVPGVSLCYSCCRRAAIAFTLKHGGIGPHDFSDETYDRPYIKAKIPAALRTAVFERDAYRCVACEGYRDLTCDHIVPESKGGPTSLENLQAMCRSCNSSKGNRA